MQGKLDKRINEIFKCYEDVRLADVQGDPTRLRRRLAEGLAQSCLTLQEVQEIEMLTSVKPDKRTSMILAQGAQLKKFLAVERRLLEFTKLDPGPLHYLMEALRLTLESKSEAPEGWRQDLETLTTLVCGEAKKRAVEQRSRSLLRRAIVAAGGGLVATMNLLPLPELPISPEIKVASTTAGVSLISTAAKDYLKKFFEA